MVINLLSLIGTFNGCPAFVDGLPLLRSADSLGKETKVVAAMRVVRPAIFGFRASAGWGAPPLLAVLGFIESIRLHRVPLRADRNACRRNLDAGVRSRILLATVVEINEGFDGLVIKKQVDRFRIMSGIKKHLSYRAQGETLLEFNGTHDQTDRIMPGSRMQSGV
jgi:hypothetical protein